MARSNKQVETRAVRRLNVRALVILGIVLAVALIAWIPFNAYTANRLRRSALAQAQAEAESGKIDSALKNLQAYVRLYPTDIPGMELYARLMAESSSTLDALSAAALVNDQLLRMDPKGPNRRETKIRLVKLYILHGDAIRQIDPSRKESGTDAFEIRYRAAVTLARQLVVEKPQEAVGHRLLAMALDGLVSSGDVKLLPEAVDEYRQALQLDPGDFASAERLAQYLSERLHDNVGAEATLDALLKAKPGSIEVRLVRYRHYLRTKEEEKGQAELEAARLIEPDNLVVLATLSNHAIIRRDNVAARGYLNAIPESRQSDLRIRVLRGMVDFAERHPDEGVDQWRQGLKTVGGSDADLTWQLAFYLIQLGRLSDARPLVAQYQRLDGNDARSMGRFLRALLEQSTGHPAKAIPDLERARDRVPEIWQSTLHVTLGRCYEAIGDEGRAMIAYRRAAVLNPSDGAPLLAISRIVSTRDPRQGLTELERVLGLTPNDPSLLFELGRVYLGEQLAKAPPDRDWRALESILDRAAKVAPDDVAIRALNCDYIANSGPLEDSARRLSKLLQGPDSKRPEAWLAYADVLRRLNRREDAVKILDEAARPENAGDHSSLRISKARVLGQSGRAKDARDALSKDRDRVPAFERPELSRALGDLLRELGDRPGARAAYAEWARKQTDSPRPGLTLLEFANTYGDDEAARLGLQALADLGSEQEPYGLASKAIELLRPARDRPKDPIPTSRIEEADRLVSRLQLDAPQLPVGHLLRGMIFELKNKPNEAVAAYRLALKDNAMTPALPRLVELLTREKRYDDLANLKRIYDEQLNPGRRLGLSVAFDQIAAAASLKAGDVQRAEQSIAQIVQARPDDVMARARQAQLLAELGKSSEAEATLTDLVVRHPEDPITWIALVTYQHQKGAPGDAARTIQRARTDYAGERREVVVGRCLWLINDIPAAAKEYEAALTKAPTDLMTLRYVAEFDAANGRTERLMTTLRTALKLDPKASWAAREMAMTLTSNKPDQAAWSQAWALIAPGAPGAGEEPEDRMIRAIVLARSAERSRRAEATPALASLVEDFAVTNPIVAEARIRLAQAFLDYDRPSEAVNFIQPVVEDTVQPRPAALILAVEAMSRTGKAEEATRLADRLAEIEPNSPRTKSAKAWALSAKNRGPEAAALLVSAASEAESAADGEKVCLGFLEQLVKFAQPAALDQLARRVAVRWPADAFYLGRQQVSSRDFAGALVSARSAIEAGSVREGARVAANVASLIPNDRAMVDQAHAIIELGRGKDPSVAEIYIFLATIHHIEGKYAEEISFYQKAIERKPQNLLFLNNMAWTLSEGLNQPKPAIDRIEELIRVEGAIYQYLDTRGVILTRLGQFDRAIADLERAAPLDPSPTTYFHLARAYLKAGKLEESRKARDLARKGRFNPDTLDPTDRADLKEVMGDS